jgi:hypothetical protein
MRTSPGMAWVWAILLVLCIVSNLAAEKIITSPDWPDPFVAGKLIVMFTEEATEAIASALEQGVEEGQVVAIRSPGSSTPWPHKFVLSDPDTRPLVTGIASIDSLHRTYGLKSIKPLSRSDPYGRNRRSFVLVFPEDIDVLHLMELYAQLEVVEDVCPSVVGKLAAIQLSSWGRIKALYSERRSVR